MENIFQKAKAKWAGIEENKRSIIRSFVCLFLLPALGVILIQSLSPFLQIRDQSIYYWPDWLKELGPRFIFNYLLLFFCYAILLFLPKFKITSIVLTVLLFFYGLAEYHVILYKRSIIYPWDLFQLKLVSEIAGGYKFRLDRYVLFAVGIFVLMIALSLFSKKFSMGVKKRTATLLAVCVCTFFYFAGFVGNYRVQKIFGMFYVPFTAISDNMYNGVLFNLSYQIQAGSVTKPDGYSKTEVEKTLAEQDALPETIVPGGEKPDIFIVVNESFCDLQSSSDFTTSTEVLPYFKSLSGDNVIKKNLCVSVWGGGTPNTETEVLTGYSMHFFPLGSYPFIQYFNGAVQGLPSVLNDAGYVSEAIHPFSPEGWKRDEVFPNMGFSNFYSIDSFENPETVRNFISDSAAYDFMIDRYEEQKVDDPDQPVFEYLITMQNHGGYDDTENLPDPIDINTAKEYPEAEQYMSILRESDEALKELIGYFEKAEDPVVIVFLGDHHPNIADGFAEYIFGNPSDMSLDPMLREYTTPLLIWANYDLSGSVLAGIESEFISTNYVPALISDIVGIEDEPFFSFLLETCHEVPVITAYGFTDNNGVFFPRDDKEAPEKLKDIIKEYEKLQYYYIERISE